MADASVRQHLLCDLPQVTNNQQTTAQLEFIDTAGAGYDACVFSGKRTQAALAALPTGMPVVADLCDATSARLRAALADGPRLRAPRNRSRLYLTGRA